MNVARLITRPCTITTRADSGVDEYGNPTTVETSTAGLCEIQQSDRSEDRIDADTQTSVWRIFFPTGTIVDGHAYVTVDDGSYELAGPPWTARNPRTGLVTHLEATARRVT